MITDLIYLLLGIIGLYFGAEWLVGGSSKLALKVGVSPLVIGLTVVALGTSAPELAVCLRLNFEGRPDAAIGNIVGSNICNILLILGFSSLIRPLKVHRQIIRKELPILLIVSFALILMLINQEVAKWEGVVLCAGIVIYILSSFKGANNNSESVGEDLSLADVSVEDRRHSKTFPLVLLLLSGLILLVLGASFFEKGGIGLAKSFGVSEAVIGLTLLAFGTSLPELATSLVACIKNEGDIIAGNAIGSSIFNILAILGITAMFKPLLVNDINLIDYSIMIGVVILCWLFVFKKMNLNRIKGGLFLCLYAGYIINILYR
ncbi:MAG: calcium/sodium antiporter [Verrucomicrobiota bacterium]|jgi:cation:H+ antiporter|nr:calcium/sodium antiporter [Verrucomicrobiota bacterium]|tara:strand:+ start:759 stop:1715 length:957 start_codon:yes stop_codon:yes gene_type:complete